MMNMQGSTVMGSPPPPLAGGGPAVASSMMQQQQPQLQPPPPHVPHMQQQQPPLHPPHHSQRFRPEDAATYITVSDPVQHADGLNKYTSYRVDTRPPMMQHNDATIVPSDVPPSAVLRRYSDFLWLSDRLSQDRPGAVVPPLPEKQPVGRFSPTFVEERRLHLERFLRRVAVHPELQDCSVLDVFLRADEHSFSAAKLTSTSSSVAAANSNTGMMAGSSFMPNASSHYGGAQQPTSPPKKEGIKRWFAEAKTSMTGDLVRSPDDELFDEINRYVHGLDSQMRNVSQQATGLVRKGKEIANGLFEFGLAFNLLGQSEADALGSALSSMGETADKLSVISAEQAEKEMAQFEEPLQDYIKMIHAVKLALHRRHEKRLTYSTRLAEVESKQQQLHKLRSQLGSEAKAYTVEMSLRKHSQAADVARDDFCACSQRVLREVDRFKREKAEDMRRTVLDYINLQVEYNKRMEQIWATLIPELERVPENPSSGVGGPATSGQGHPTTVSPDPSQMNPAMPQGGSFMAPTPPYQPQQQAAPPMNQPPAPDPSSMLSVQYRETPGGF